MKYKFSNPVFLTKEEMLQLSDLAGNESMSEYMAMVLRKHLASQQTDSIKDVIIIRHRPHCTRHDVAVVGKYSELRDAYYCELCSRWLSDKCNNLNCKYCKDRPDKPSSV